MANKAIGYYLVKNETGNGSGYFIRIVPNGVVYWSELLESVMENFTTTKNRAEMIWTEAVKVALKHALRGETVDLGGVRIRPVISGSSPCEDSDYAEGSGEMLVLSYVDTELADTFDNVIPYRINLDDLATKVKVSNIMDVASQAFGVIDGTNEFVVLGNNLTLDADGEYVKLLDRKSGEAKATATVKRVSKGQRAYCELPSGSAIAAGDYTCEIASKGLIGATTPEIFRKAVELVTAVVPPEPVTVTKVTCSAGDGKILREGNSTVYGTGFSRVARFKLDYIAAQSGEAAQYELPINSIDRETGTAEVASSISLITDPVDFDKPVRVFVYDENDELLAQSGDLEYVTEAP